MLGKQWCLQAQPSNESLYRSQPTLWPLRPLTLFSHQGAWYKERSKYVGGPPLALAPWGPFDSPEPLVSKSSWIFTQLIPSLHLSYLNSGNPVLINLDKCQIQKAFLPLHLNLPYWRWFSIYHLKINQALGYCALGLFNQSSKNELPPNASVSLGP